jgi:hypothetical protein
VHALSAQAVQAADQADDGGDYLPAGGGLKLCEHSPPQFALQIDLFDKRSKPAHGMNWVLSMKDHATKFVWLAALPDKKCTESI